MIYEDFKKHVHKPYSSENTSGDASSRERNLERILKITKHINRSLVLDDVLELVLKNAIDLANADRGFVVLKDEGENLKYKLGMNAKGQILPESNFDISTSVVEEVHYSNRSKFVESAQNDFESDPSKSIIDLELQTILCSPLIIGKKKIGVIYVDSKRFQKIKVKEVTDTFEILANQAAIAINNAQQYTNQQKSHLELKEINDELKTAKEEAEKSDRLKSEFLAQISHEIRTPINSIINFNYILKNDLEKHLNDELKENFEYIEVSTKRLIRTIDLILNMSQIQSGNTYVNFEEVDIDKLVLSNLIIEFKETAEKKNIELNYSNYSTDTKVYCDKYTIIEVFRNLIDNAVKFTDKGSVDITLRNNEEGKLNVDVSDTGTGISKEYLPKLFHPFSQETTGYTRKYDGNGLGLAIVRKYIELNNARINVESEKGAGSKFTVVFS